jgi:hypothetical protein
VGSRVRWSLARQGIRIESRENGLGDLCAPSLGILVLSHAMLTCCQVGTSRKKAAARRASAPGPRASYKEGSCQAAPTDHSAVEAAKRRSIPRIRSSPTRPKRSVKRIPAAAESEKVGSQSVRTGDLILASPAPPSRFFPAFRTVDVSPIVPAVDGSHATSFQGA